MAQKHAVNTAPSLCSIITPLLSSSAVLPRAEGIAATKASRRLRSGIHHNL